MTFDAVVGALESREFRRQSRMLSERWGARYEERVGYSSGSARGSITGA